MSSILAQFQIRVFNDHLGPLRLRRNVRGALGRSVLERVVPGPREISLRWVEGYGHFVDAVDPHFCSADAAMLLQKLFRSL